jgi:PIF1-like helicase
MPSDFPWEAVRLYYERMYYLKTKFWKTPAAQFGDLREMVTRMEFQLRGAIHSHLMLWVSKTIPQMIDEKFIRADLPDRDHEPELYDLVVKYQVHDCKPHICGGPGAGPNGKCRKLFPADVSDRTYHREGDKRYTYARTERDIYVVPYNAELLLLWEGHINVQYVTDANLVAYIIKYLTKVEPYSLLNIPNGGTRTDAHILARRMGSMEQIVMALGYDMVRCTTSSIFLPTALPSMRNSTVRPPYQITQDPDNPYYPDALEKYFARPDAYEDLTYFKYFQVCEISKKRIMNRDGPRPGYERNKTKLIRTPYRRLCDGESFFLHHLLSHRPWRSDDEILGGCGTYRERLFMLQPILFQNLLVGHDERELSGRLAIGNEYLEMVQRIAEALPIDLRELVQRQLAQLNTMTVPGLMDAASVTLRGEQYRCYTAVTQNILASANGGRCFFVTGPGGTGKSFLLKAIQHWCSTSRNACILLAPTGIAARNIGGSTIYSALSIFTECGEFQTSLFSHNEEKRDALAELKVIILDEISMVDGVLLDKISSIFMKIKKNTRPFGGLHVIALGDLLQLPPVDGIKVWNAAVWPLFYPIFLREPQRQSNRRFFDVLNKIRFGIVDDDVKQLLTECWQRHNPAVNMWMTTYLCPLKDEADDLNQLVLDGLPSNEADLLFHAEDYENDERLTSSSRSRIFKRGTNFPPVVTCKVGAKVMFLTNSMLAQKGIANGSLGVITEILADGDIKAAFPTEQGIQVRQHQVEVTQADTHSSHPTILLKAANKKPVYSRLSNCIASPRPSRKTESSIDAPNSRS